MDILHKRKEKKEMFSSAGKVVKSSEVKPHPITRAEVEAITNMVRSMDVAELEIVADNIPIELCFQRVEREIKKYKAFAEATKGAIDILND